MHPHQRRLLVRQPVTSAQQAGCSADCVRHDQLEDAFMITRRERQRELSSSDDDLSPAPPVFGLQNSYNPLTRDGQDAIERRESLQATTAVDRWLNANRNLCHRADYRMMTTELFSETATCEVHKKVVRYVYPDDPSSPFASDAHIFATLYLRLILSESSGIRAGLRSSPLAILEQWDSGKIGDSPDWVEFMDEDDVYSFTQPRCLAGDCFATLATSSSNVREGYSDAMLRWAHDVSPIQQARLRVRREGRARGARGNGDGLRRSSRRLG